MSRKTRKQVGPPFPGLEVPGPPAALRESVLGKARQALARAPGLDPWTRLWESRVARLAWAACVVGLLAAHLAIGPVRKTRGDRSPVALQVRPAADDEVNQLARLPRLRLDLLLGEMPVDEPASDGDAEDEEENS
jgi:hypothetical protein